MVPAFYLGVEGVSWASCADCISVPLQDVGRHQSPSVYSTGRQLISHQPHGVLRRKTGVVVTNKGHAVAFGVVSVCVGSLIEPAPAFVDVSISASNKASKEFYFECSGYLQHLEVILKR